MWTELSVFSEAEIGTDLRLARFTADSVSTCTLKEPNFSFIISCVVLGLWADLRDLLFLGSFFSLLRGSPCAHVFTTFSWLSIASAVGKGQCEKII